jgi:hypothetical protein
MSCELLEIGQDDKNRGVTAIHLYYSKVDEPFYGLYQDFET